MILNIVRNRDHNVFLGLFCVVFVFLSTVTSDLCVMGAWHCMQFHLTNGGKQFNHRVQKIAYRKIPWTTTLHIEPFLGFLIYFSECRPSLLVLDLGSFRC